MDRYIFVFRKDKNVSHQVHSWVENSVLPQTDDSTPTTSTSGSDAGIGDNKPLIKWLLVTEDFGQVCSVPSLQQWIDVDTLKQHMEDDKALFGDEDVVKQDIESVLHKTADSIPCIGCKTQIYMFLHPDDLDLEEWGIGLIAGLWRLLLWLHARIVFVKMESKLSSSCEKLAFMLSAQVASIEECLKPIRMSWTGVLNFPDRKRRDGVGYRGYYISYPQWETVLKYIQGPKPQKTVAKRGRGRKNQEKPPMVDSGVRTRLVGKHIDYVRFPSEYPGIMQSLRILLQELSGVLSLFDDSFVDTLLQHNLELYKPLIERVLRNFTNTAARDGPGQVVQSGPYRGLGLICRVRVYKVDGNIPLCGDTSHMSTSAFKDHICGGSTSDDHEYPVSSPYEYLNLLIMRNPELTPSALFSWSERIEHRFRVRILSSNRDLARYMLSVLNSRSCDSITAGERSGGRRTQRDDDNNDVDASSVQMGKHNSKDKEQDRNEEWMKCLPVFKARDFLSVLGDLNECQMKAREDESSSNLEFLSSNLMNILEAMRSTSHTLCDAELEFPDDENQEWISEAALGVTECPEWKALAADDALVGLSSKGGRDPSSATKDNGASSSSSATLSKQKSIDQTGCKEFSIDHILRVFKEDDNARLEAKLDMNPFRRLSTDSPSEGTNVDTGSKRHDIYQYNTEEDYDLEARYAQIRDQTTFQDTMSSFVTPKKKAVRPFTPTLPTRSSPRTKLFAHKPSTSRSPPKLAGVGISRSSTFKHPQSLHGSSSSVHRKRLHSSLTPDTTACPPSSQHCSSSSSSTGIGGSSQTRKHLAASSLTPKSSYMVANRGTSGSHRRQLTPDLDLSQSYDSTSSLHRKRTLSSSFTPESEASPPSKFARTSTPSSPSSSSSFISTFDPASERSPVSNKHASCGLSSSSLSLCKRVPFTTVLDMPESGVRRSPRKLSNSQSSCTNLVKAPQPESSLASEKAGPSDTSKKPSTKSTPPNTSTKMKRSERHMMRLKSIIAKVLMEKGVGKDDPIYQACSKNLLNVSIVLLKSLPNSLNLTDEMKSVVYSQVQQIINLEKRRSGIAL